MLLGYRHTHFDDVESFLYVLLLFLFSYAGPLPKGVLQDAHEKGFVRPIGSGALPHMRRWPHKLAAWADGDPRNIASSKLLYIWSADGVQSLYDDAEISDSLGNNWPEDLHSPIRDLLDEAFGVFGKSVIGRQVRTQVSHAQFIKVLDDWLEKHSELGHKYSENHPEFEDTRSVEIRPLHGASLANRVHVSELGNRAVAVDTYDS